MMSRNYLLPDHDTGEYDFFLLTQLVVPFESLDDSVAEMAQPQLVRITILIRKQDHISYEDFHK